MKRHIVIYDACVLYPAPLRDLLMHVALTDLFQAKWTNDIHEEWIRNVLKNRPDLKRRQLERTRDLMNQSILDCLVTDYEPIIPKIKLPDVNDRHVLAAAIKARASIILTFNIKDFPAKELKEYGISAKHPDDFLMELFSVDSAAICFAVQRLRKMLKNPPITIYEYLGILKQQDLKKFSAQLSQTNIDL